MEICPPNPRDLSSNYHLSKQASGCELTNVNNYGSVISPKAVIGFSTLRIVIILNILSTSILRVNTEEAVALVSNVISVSISCKCG